LATVETLTQRNEGFAADEFSADLLVIPSLKTVVVTCADARVIQLTSLAWS
jgi:carbonic anhydrase